MATIVPFIIRPRVAMLAASGKRTATIIIFPGVRYEREQESKSAGKGRGKRGAGFDLAAKTRRKKDA